MLENKLCGFDLPYSLMKAGQELIIMGAVHLKNKFIWKMRNLIASPHPTIKVITSSFSLLEIQLNLLKIVPSLVAIQH